MGVGSSHTVVGKVDSTINTVNNIIEEPCLIAQLRPCINSVISIDGVVVDHGGDCKHLIRASSQVGAREKIRSCCQIDVVGCFYLV